MPRNIRLLPAKVNIYFGVKKKISGRGGAPRFSGTFGGRTRPAGADELCGRARASDIKMCAPREMFVLRGG